MAAADFDGNEDPDLATACFDAARVRLFANDGSAGFTPDAVAGGVPAGAGSTFVAAADWNGDGRPDLAVANQSENNVSVILNQSSWNFAGQVKYTVGSQPIALGPADLDGDGDLDLAVANYMSFEVTILAGAGDGSFTTQMTLVTPTADEFGPLSLLGRDLDGDGDADLAVANDRPRNVSVFKNAESWSFGAPTNYPVGTQADPRGEPNSLTAGDLDGDNDLDLATANWSSSTVSILRNQGNGTFASRQNYAACPVTSALVTADVDGDLDLDLAVVNQGMPQNVQTFWNDGTGAFAPGGKVVAGDGAYQLTAADLNRDSLPDVAVASRLASDVRVYLTGSSRDEDANLVLDSCERPRVGDCTEDGLVDISDTAKILLFLYQGGPPWPCLFDGIGDVNGDGRIDISDAVFLFNHLLHGSPAELRELTPEQVLACQEYEVQEPPSLAQVELGLDGAPVELTGAPGERKSFEVFATITTRSNSTRRGPHAWSLALSISGGTLTSASLQDLTINALEGGLGDSNLTPREILLSGGLGGAQVLGDSRSVSAVELPATGALYTLQPTGVQRVCRFTAEAVIPEDGSSQELTLEFRDYIRGAGPAVRNVATFIDPSGNAVSHPASLGRVTVRLRATAGGSQVPGDCNQDGTVDLSDAVCLLGYLFLGSPSVLPCEGGTAFDPGNQALVNFNGDAAVDLSDAVGLLQWLFSGAGPHVLGESCLPIESCPDAGCAG